jgi:hypothetical protein
MGLQSPTEQKTQLSVQKLNNNTTLCADSIPVELLKHGEEVMNKIHKLVGIYRRKKE